MSVESGGEFRRKRVSMQCFHSSVQVKGEGIEALLLARSPFCCPFVSFLFCKFFILLMLLLSATVLKVLVARRYATAGFIYREANVQHFWSQRGSNSHGSSFSFYRFSFCFFYLHFLTTRQFLLPAPFTGYHGRLQMSLAFLPSAFGRNF